MWNTMLKKKHFSHIEERDYYLKKRIFFCFVFFWRKGIRLLESRDTNHTMKTKLYFTVSVKCKIKNVLSIKIIYITFVLGGKNIYWGASLIHFKREGLKRDLVSNWGQKIKLPLNSYLSTE